ncbi:MAG: DUF3343 domain-containing protein [Anaerotruncus sp.]|nr:DUF3343 domain-containing protein [Anaerotruncus sp.]
MRDREAFVLVVRSVTSAMKGQKLLEQNGITAFVQRNSMPNSTQGCGYALKIYGDVSRAISILYNVGIQVTEIQQGG